MRDDDGPEGADLAEVDRRATCARGALERSLPAPAPPFGPVRRRAARRRLLAAGAVATGIVAVVALALPHRGDHGERIAAGPGAAGAPTTTPARPVPTSTSTSTASTGGTAIDLELVSITPSAPRPGQIVEIAVRAEAEGLLAGFRADLGDGRSVEQGAGNGCNYGPAVDFAEPPPPPVGPTEQVLSLTTTYATAGPHPLTFTVRAFDSCADLDVPVGESTRSLTFTLAVAEGPAPGNGERPPTADLLESIGWGGTDVQVVASGKDPDGWISTLRVDWGDGSEPTVLQRSEPCAPGPGGWPADSAFSRTIQHTYPAPGEYVARLQVVSTACDGTREQRASSENVVVYPSR